MKRFFGSILNCARLDIQGLMKFNFLTPPGMGIREYVTLNEHIDRSQRVVKPNFMCLDEIQIFYF